MARDKRDQKEGRKASRASFERIEFQAPVGFLKRIDRLCARRGLSRSAYIRQAVLLLMREDERESNTPPHE